MITSTTGYEGSTTTPATIFAVGTAVEAMHLYGPRAGEVEHGEVLSADSDEFGAYYLLDVEYQWGTGTHHRKDRFATTVCRVVAAG
jgi:hypothetical protein